MPNRYDASAIVQIDPRQKSITQLDSVVSDLRGDNSTVESELEIIKSRPIILQVIETLDLRNDPEFQASSGMTRLLTRLGISMATATPVERTPQRPRDQIADILIVDEPGASRPESDEIADAFMRSLVACPQYAADRHPFLGSNPARRPASPTRLLSLPLDRLDPKTRRLDGNCAAEKNSMRCAQSCRCRASRAQWKAEHNVFDSEARI
jgi:hypothetical protein